MRSPGTSCAADGTMAKEQGAARVPHPLPHVLAALDHGVAARGGGAQQQSLSGLAAGDTSSGWCWGAASRLSVAWVAGVEVGCLNLLVGSKEAPTARNYTSGGMAGGGRATSTW